MLDLLTLCLTEGHNSMATFLSEVTMRSRPHQLYLMQTHFSVKNLTYHLPTFCRSVFEGHKLQLVLITF